MRMMTASGRVGVVVMGLLWAISAKTELRGQSTSEWITLLEDQNGQTRVAAAQALGALAGTQEGTKGAPALVAALKKEQNNEVRIALMRAVAKLGPVAGDAVPDLIAALEDEEMRYHAILALGAMGSKGKAAVAPLIALLRDKKVGNAAARALGKIGLDAVPALVEACGSKDAVVRARAAYALGELGTGMQQDVGGGDTQLTSANPVLVTALGDENGDVRYWSAYALGELRSKDPAAISALVAALDDKDQAVRSQAARALGKIGGDAVPQLLQALKHEHATVRLGAARALGEVRGEAAAETVGVLAELLKDDDDGVRYQAAVALKSIGKNAGAAAPALVAALKDENRSVRGQSADALVRIGGASVKPLIPSLKDEVLRYEALRILRQLGPAAKPSVAAVTETLADGDENVRYESIRILTIFGPEAKAAVPQLEKLVAEDADERVREAAKEALAKIKVEEPEKKK